jgi:hypothetical protein
MKKIIIIFLASFILPLIFLWFQIFIQDPMPFVKDYIDNLYLQAIATGYLFSFFGGLLIAIVKTIFFLLDKD